MNPEQLKVPVERRRDPKRCLEAVDSFLGLAPGVIYVAEETVTVADRILFAFP
jgi:hypothetical protein